MDGDADADGFGDEDVVELKRVCFVAVWRRERKTRLWQCRHIDGPEAGVIDFGRVMVVLMVQRKRKQLYW